MSEKKTENTTRRNGLITRSFYTTTIYPIQLQGDKVVEGTAFTVEGRLDKIQSTRVAIEHFNDESIMVPRIDHNQTIYGMTPEVFLANATKITVDAPVEPEPSAQENTYNGGEV